mgnify:CR=1 FL=1
MLIKNVDYINQYSHTRQVLKEVKTKHGINKGQFEVLCAAYSLQNSQQPYFIVPRLVERLETLSKVKVYNYIKELTQKGYVEMCIKTSSPCVANYYNVTGCGESVLRYYIKNLNVKMGKWYLNV